MSSVIPPIFTKSKLRLAFEHMILNHPDFKARWKFDESDLDRIDGQYFNGVVFAAWITWRAAHRIFK